MTFETNFKPSRTVRKKAERRTKLDRKSKERIAMTAARRRDTVCRFPLCGCRKLKLQSEVAHLRHRGMGGNPSGDRTDTAILILLCNHRHRFGAISLHAGTLRPVALTAEGCDGPVRWEALLGLGDTWTVLATETRVRVWEPLTMEQARALADLAEMDQ